MGRGFWVIVAVAVGAVGLLVLLDSEPEGTIDGPVLAEPDGDGVRSIMMAALQGTLAYDEANGCLYLEAENGQRSAVIWPPRTTWRSDPPGVVLADGQVVEPGDHVEGGGGGVGIGNLSRRVGEDVKNAVAACDEFGATMLQVITRISPRVADDADCEFEKGAPPPVSATYEVLLPDGRRGANPGPNGWVLETTAGEATRIVVTVSVTGLPLESVVFELRGEDLVIELASAEQLAVGSHEIVLEWSPTAGQAERAAGAELRLTATTTVLRAGDGSACDVERFDPTPQQSRASLGAIVIGS